MTSADGTTIALERKGQGPPVILIGGAFNDRTTVAGLASVLAPTFTAVAYDRRGRGDSGDSGTYAVEREIEDIAALIGHVGAPVKVFGHSSGAILAIDAAAAGLAIDRLVLYEPVYVIENTRPRAGADLADRLRALIGQDRRDDAVTLFLTEGVAVPAEMVEGMRANPQMWGLFTKIAHTLPYDVTICGPGAVMPADRLAAIEIPTLAIGGSLSPEALTAPARAVANAIPGARHITLEGQDHGVLNQPEALRALLTEFFS
ncbi:MAG: alpha/beta fold hydrolase [Micromonosporaceae bacterium]